MSGEMCFDELNGSVDSILQEKCASCDLRFDMSRTLSQPVMTEYKVYWCKRCWTEHINAKFEMIGVVEGFIRRDEDSNRYNKKHVLPENNSTKITGAVCDPPLKDCDFGAGGMYNGSVFPECQDDKEVRSWKNTSVINESSVLTRSVDSINAGSALIHREVELVQHNEPQGSNISEKRIWTNESGAVGTTYPGHVNCKTFSGPQSCVSSSSSRGLMLCPKCGRGVLDQCCCCLCQEPTEAMLRTCCGCKNSLLNSAQPDGPCKHVLCQACKSRSITHGMCVACNGAICNFCFGEFQKGSLVQLYLCAHELCIICLNESRRNGRHCPICVLPECEVCKEEPSTTAYTIEPLKFRTCNFCYEKRMHKKGCLACRFIRLDVQNDLS